MQLNPQFTLEQSVYVVTPGQYDNEAIVIKGKINQIIAKHDKDGNLCFKYSVDTTFDFFDAENICSVYDLDTLKLLIENFSEVEDGQ